MRLQSMHKIALDHSMSANRIEPTVIMLTSIQI